MRQWSNAINSFPLDTTVHLPNTTANTHQWDYYSRSLSVGNSGAACIVLTLLLKVIINSEIILKTENTGESDKKQAEIEWKLHAVWGG